MLGAWLSVLCAVCVLGSVQDSNAVAAAAFFSAPKADWETGQVDGLSDRTSVISVAHKTDDDDGSPQATTVDDELETLMQEALVVYNKIKKLDVMGGEEGLRKRMLSYGAGLAPEDPERVSRAREFLELVKKRFAKLLKRADDEL